MTGGPGAARTAWSLCAALALSAPALGLATVAQGPDAGILVVPVLPPGGLDGLDDGLRSGGWPIAFPATYRAYACGRLVMDAQSVLVPIPVEARPRHVDGNLVILPSVILYSPPCIVVAKEAAVQTGGALVLIRNLDVVTHTPSDFLRGFAKPGECFQISVAPGRVLELTFFWDRLGTLGPLDHLYVTQHLAGDPPSPRRDCGVPPHAQAGLGNEVPPALDPGFQGIDVVRIDLRCAIHNFDGLIVIPAEAAK